MLHMKEEDIGWQIANTEANMNMSREEYYKQQEKWNSYRTVQLVIAASSHH